MLGQQQLRRVIKNLFPCRVRSKITNPLCKAESNIYILISQNTLVSDKLGFFQAMCYGEERQWGYRRKLYSPESEHRLLGVCDTARAAQWPPHPQGQPRLSPFSTAGARWRREAAWPQKLMVHAGFGQWWHFHVSRAGGGAGCCALSLLAINRSKTGGLKVGLCGVCSGHLQPWLTGTQEGRSGRMHNSEPGWTIQGKGVSCIPQQAAHRLAPRPSPIRALNSPVYSHLSL